MQHHLGIFTQPLLDLILMGRKTIDSRFSKIRCAPYLKVNTGDLVYLKESGGYVKGQFTASKVETYTDLTPELLHDICRSYHRQIFVNTHYQDFWEKWTVSKYATLIHIENVIAYQNPFSIQKKDARAWVVLDQPHRCQLKKKVLAYSLVGGVCNPDLSGNEHKIGVANPSHKRSESLS